MLYITQIFHWHFDGLVQDCNNSSVLAMELLQFGAEPLICPWRSLEDKFTLHSYDVN